MEIFNNLCRACNTAQNNLLNIYTDQQNDSATIKKMLEYCLLMPIHKESMYPELICYFCVKQLEVSYRFLQRFKIAQKEFEISYEHIKKLQGNRDVDDDCKKMGEIVKEKANNEYDKHVEQPQIIDAIKIKPTNIIDEHLESVGSVHAIEKQNVCTVINIAKSESLQEASCSICEKVFFTPKALHLHLKLSHKGKISNCARNVIAEKSKIGNLDETFEYKSNIDYNKSTKHPQTEADIKLEYTKSNANVGSAEVAKFIPAIIEQKSDVAKNCSVCDKSFFTSKALNLHLKLAHKQKFPIT